MKNRWYAFVILWWLCCGVETQPREVAEDILFIKALRARRLYELAERQCRESLQTKNLSPEERAAVTIEWIESLGEHALFCEGERRAQLWKQAYEIAAEFCHAHDGTPWTLPVRPAAAKALVSQGKVLRLQAELSRLAGSVGDNAAAESAARSILQQAVREMREVENAVGELLKGTNRPNGRVEDGLSEQQIVSLEKQVQFWISSAYQELAQTYAEESEDFAAALNESVKRLKVLSQLPSEHPLAFASRLSFMDSLLLLRDPVASRRVLEDLEKWDLDPHQRMLFIATWLRWAVSFHDVGTLAKWFEVAAKLEEPRPPEVNYAMLKAAVFFWESSRTENGSRKSEWENRIKELVESIRRSGSNYWTHRAELLVAQTVALGGSQQDFNMQVYIAENAYRAGRWEEAFQGYQRAAQVAQSSGQIDQSIRLSQLAAVVASEQGKYREAWQLLERVAQQFPEHPDAATVAYSGLVYLAQLVRENPESFLNVYEQRLKEFLARFGESEYAFRVGLLLGQLLEYRSRWSEALDAYIAALEKVPTSLLSWPTEDVSADLQRQPPQLAQMGETSASALQIDVSLDKLFVGLDRCCKEVFQAAEPSLAQRAQLVATRLHRWASTVPSEARFSFWVLKAEERAARIYLWWVRDPFAADQIASQLFPTPDDLQKIQAGKQEAAQLAMNWATLKLEILAHLGQDEQAEMWIEYLRSVGFEDRWQWVQDLLARFTRLEPATARRLASWGIEILPDFSQVYAGQTAAWRQKAGKDYAQFLVLAGDFDGAIGWLRQLSKEFPDVGEFQENLALLLAQQPDDALQTEALEKFREIAQRTPQGSPRWFRAKYMIVWLLIQRGQLRQALETIVLLESLYPELGGSPLKERFLALKRQCELQIGFPRPAP